MASAQMLPALKPLPVKDRMSMIFVQYGQIDALDDDLRLKVVRKMYEVRFGEPAPNRRSVEQLRVYMGLRRPPCSRQDTPRLSVLFTQANHCHLFTMLLIFTNLKRWSQWRFGSPQKALLILSVKFAWHVETCSGPVKF